MLAWTPEKARRHCIKPILNKTEIDFPLKGGDPAPESRGESRSTKLIEAPAGGCLVMHNTGAGLIADSPKRTKPIPPSPGGPLSGPPVTVPSRLCQTCKNSCIAGL